MTEKKVQPQKLPRYLTIDEVDKIRAAEPSIRNRMLMDTLFYLGLRVSECIQIKVSDLDFNNKVCRVRSEIAKRSKERYVPIPDVFCGLLRSYLDLAKIDDVIFSINRHRVWQICKAAGKRAGIVGSLHPHRFRHALAVHYLHKTNNLQFVSQVLGHSDIRQTSVYCKIPGPLVQDLVEQCFAPRAKKSGTGID